MGLVGGLSSGATERERVKILNLERGNQSYFSLHLMGLTLLDSTLHHSFPNLIPLAHSISSCFFLFILTHYFFFIYMNAL